VAWAGEGRSVAAAARSGRTLRKEPLRSGRIALGRVGRRRAAGSDVGGRRVLLRRLRGSGVVSGLELEARRRWVRCEGCARRKLERYEGCARRRRMHCEVCALRSWHARSGRSAASYGEGLPAGLVRRSELEMAQWTLGGCRRAHSDCLGGETLPSNKWEQLAGPDENMHRKAALGYVLDHG
jgi:hypothetical protein